jgi:DNA mismatch repair protein MLH1
MLQSHSSIDGAIHGGEDLDYEYTEKEPTSCRLTSIRDLRAQVRDAMHNELTDIISTHTFVGIVDEQKRIASIQGGVKLFLVDYGMLCNEYFYQVGLTDFANYGTIRLEPPLPLQKLLEIAAEQELQRNTGDGADQVDWDEVVKGVKAQLVNRRALLAEYFSLEITETGELCSIPLLVKGYTPSIAKLPQFLLRLGPYVDWESEKECFQSFLRELASFYVPESLPLPPSLSQYEGGKREDKIVDEDEVGVRREEVRHAIENVIFPACKARLVATKGMLQGVMEVANLKGLYRVFERC